MFLLTIFLSDWSDFLLFLIWDWTVFIVLSHNVEAWLQDFQEWGVEEWGEMIESSDGPSPGRKPR
jgi:hypothetical protein